MLLRFANALCCTDCRLRYPPFVLQSEDTLNLLPDTAEGAEEFALGKVLQTGKNLAKEITDFLKELDEVGAKSVVSVTRL